MRTECSGTHVDLSAVYRRANRAATAGRQAREARDESGRLAGHFVTPYRMAGKRGKNDANGAAAICEAAGRPRMRFVPVKITQQQGQLAVHCLRGRRQGFKEECTALINRIRGLLAEFGLVFPQSPEALRKALAEVIEDASNELPGVAPLALQRAHLHWIDIELQIHWCDERIASHVRSDDRARAAATLQGIGTRGETTPLPPTSPTGAMRQ